MPLKQQKQPAQCSIDSVLFNFSGKLIMIQRDTPNSPNVTVQEETVRVVPVYMHTSTTYTNNTAYHKHTHTHIRRERKNIFFLLHQSVWPPL